MPERVAQSSLDVAALRRQDAAEFTRLVAAHQDLVAGLAESLGLAGMDLEDAVAEAFAAVYRDLPGFEGRAELSTWIYRVAFRAMLRVRARLRARPVASLPIEHADPRQPAPPQLLSQRELKECLWRFVTELEPRQAAAVQLHYGRDWPLERIAGVLDCPVGTVKTLLFRARQRLRDRLEGQEYLP